MSVVFEPNMQPKDRLVLLRETADKVEITKYQKPLDQDVLDQKREELVNNAIQLNILEEELGAIKEKYKIQMKPLKQENAVLLSEVKTKQETVEGEIFQLANHIDGMMETYDAEGILLGSRRLLPNEKKQARLFVAGDRTGTND